MAESCHVNDRLGRLYDRAGLQGRGFKTIAEQVARLANGPARPPARRRMDLRTEP